MFWLAYTVAILSPFLVNESGDGGTGSAGTLKDLVHRFMRPIKQVG